MVEACAQILIDILKTGNVVIIKLFESKGRVQMQLEPNALQTDDITTNIL